MKSVLRFILTVIFALSSYYVVFLIWGFGNMCSGSSCLGFILYIVLISGMGFMALIFKFIMDRLFLIKVSWKYLIAVLVAFGIVIAAVFATSYMSKFPGKI